METFKPLQSLDLSSNRIDSSCAQAIARFLKYAKNLQELSLACNNLSPEAGEKILEGIADTTNLVKLDLRLTGCGRNVDLGVQEILRRNKFRKVDWKLVEDDSDADSDGGHGGVGGVPDTPSSAGTPKEKGKKKQKTFFKVEIKPKRVD